MRINLAYRAVFAAIIVFVALFIAPSKLYAGTAVHVCQTPTCPNNNSPTIHNRVSVNDSAHRMQRHRERRQQLMAAMADSHNGEPPLRGIAAVGFSLLILFGGLFLLSRWLKGFLYAWQKLSSQFSFLARRESFVTSAVFTAIALVTGLAFLVDGALTPKARARRLSTKQAANILNANPKFAKGLQVGGSGITQITASAFDNSGNLYVTGGFKGTIVLNTNPQTTLTSTQDFDVYIAKYDSAGNPLWARAANGGSAQDVSDGFSLDGGLSLAVDAQGNAFVGGGFVKRLSFNDPNNTVLTDAGGNGINIEEFIAKYDTNGNLLWAKGGNSGSPQNPSDLTVGINGITEIDIDGNGNPYVTGPFAGTNFLGVTVTPHGKSDILLSKLNPANGNPVWVQNPGSAEGDGVLGMGIDSSANLYIIGEIDGTITFPTQPQPTMMTVDQFTDTFVAKYDSGGQVIWAKQIGGDQFINGTHIAVNQTGEIYLTGSFDGTATFDSITISDTGGGISGFLAKLNTSGTTIWARKFGQPGGAEGERVALDGAGNPHVSGIFSDQTEFGSESPATAQTITSMGEDDQFIAKYDPSGALQWAKDIAGSGAESENIINGPAVPVEILPISLTQNRLTGAMYMTGDFSGTLTLDDTVLDTGGPDRRGFVAQLNEEVAATPTGSQVFVQLNNSSVTYNSVSSAGDTFANPLAPDTVGPLPQGYTLIGPAYFIGSYANYSGPLKVCVSAPNVTDPTVFSYLKLLHNEGGTLVDRTTAQNFGAKLVCGSVTSLSPFVVAQSASPTAAPTRISGQVLTSGGEPLGGVVMQLSGARTASTITDARGYYEFSALAVGQIYTIIPELAGYSFAPSGRSLSLLSDRTDALFTATAESNPVNNPIDTAAYFVRQQYLDFLTREPEPDGLAYWAGEITRCNGDANCIHNREIDVSAAFFMSDEFQQTGSFVYRLYKGALGRQLNYQEFSADRQQVIGGDNLDAAKAAFANSFVQRAEFQQKYSGATNAENFVDALIQNVRQASVTDLSGQRSTLVAKYNSGSSMNESRSLAVRQAIEDASFKSAEYNKSFVLMQYFGYLKRDPEQAGYEFWLNVLDNGDRNNYRGMVCSFLTSEEYQKRFSSVVSHSNQECR